MIRSIAFIHTVALLVDRFRPRFQAELPQQRCFHMLDESVLQDLLRDGPSPAITRRIVTLATLAVSVVLMYSVKATGTLRVSREGEIQGLDLHEHGMLAYPEYVIHGFEPTLHGTGGTGHSMTATELNPVRAR